MTKDEIILAQQARIEQLCNFIKHAQVSSGVCCCGDSMEGHPSPMACGHSPVDMWDYHSAKLLETVPDDLSGKVAELEAENTLHKSAMDNLAAKLTEAERQLDELMACLNLIYSWANNWDSEFMNDPDWINTDYPRIQAAIAKVKGQP